MLKCTIGGTGRKSCSSLAVEETLLSPGRRLIQTYRPRLREIWHFRLTLFTNSNVLCGTGKRPLGRPWLRWGDNIRMDLEEININEGNLVVSAHDRVYWRALVNAALNLRVQ